MTIKVKLNNLEYKIKKAVKGMRSDGFTKKLTEITMKPVQDDAFRYKTGKRFRKLHPLTIEKRKQIAKNNKTHPAYSPEKPNLTITGRFLRSFKWRIGTKKGAILFKLDARGMHTPYRGSDGKPIGKPIKNKQIRNELAKIGRDPIEFSKKYTKLIMDILKDELRDRLR